jgi:hypothetical protein
MLRIAHCRRRRRCRNVTRFVRAKREKVPALSWWVLTVPHSNVRVRHVVRWSFVKAGTCVLS